MQHKQRFTNVTLVTPSGEEDKDLLIEGDKIVQILNRNENLFLRIQSLIYKTLKIKMKEVFTKSVSYTHLTLPTTPYV